MPTLWIPPDADVRAKQYLCRNCGQKFFADHKQQYTRHVVACVRKNPEAIEAHREFQRSNAFTGILDTEQYEWVRQRAAEGKKATKGGRAA